MNNNVFYDGKTFWYNEKVFPEIPKRRVATKDDWEKYLEDKEIFLRESVPFEDQQLAKSLIVKQNFGDYNVKRFKDDPSSVDYLFEPYVPYRIDAKVEVVPLMLTKTSWETPEMFEERKKAPDNGVIKVARIVESKEESPEPKEFTRRELELAFCIGMLNQGTDFTMDKLSEQLITAQSRIDKFIESVRQNEFNTRNPK
jgi:hypothetical protein